MLKAIIWAALASTLAIATPGLAKPRPNLPASFVSNLADGSPLTTITVGPPVLTSMQFGAGGAVTPDENKALTASYSGLQLSDRPKRFMADFTLSEGAPGATNESGSAVIIANRNGLSAIELITSGSLHVVFTRDYALVGCFEAGQLQSDLVRYYAPISVGPENVHRAGYELAADKLTLITPAGEVVVLPGAKYWNCAGPFVQIEAYFLRGGRVATFKRVEVVAQ